MGDYEKALRADVADEEVRKAHLTIWLGEGLLWKAHAVAHWAAERHRDLTGQPLAPADDWHGAQGDHHAG